MNSFEVILNGKDLRSIGESNAVVALVKEQHQFDELFQLLYHPNRNIVMRAADAVEKITLTKPDYLQLHKTALLDLLLKANAKELKWHLALLVARLRLSYHEFSIAWRTLQQWANDKRESKIVRVNALQGLHELLKQKPERWPELLLLASQLWQEKIPSLNARIRKLKLEEQ